MVKKCTAIFTVLLLTFLSPMAAVSVYGAEARLTAPEFPDKTIIIGTHAIYLDCLTQPLLEVAESSAASENQMSIYFKSDINKGVWYDITTSSDITDISAATDNAVSNDVIDGLVLTHYTKPTGETVEFSTGAVVNVSDIDSVEWPENMPELDGITEELEFQTKLRDQDDLSKERKALYEAHVSSLERLLARIETTEVTKLHDEAVTLDRHIVQMEKEQKSSHEISLATQSLNAVMEEKDAYCYQAEILRFEDEIAALDYIDSATLIEKYNEWLTNLKGVQPAADAIIDKSGGEADNTESALNEMFEAAQQAYTEAVINGGSTDAALEEWQAIDSLMKNDSFVSDHIKEKQVDVLERVKDNTINNLLNGAADPSLAADEINTYDDLLIDRLDNLDDILAALEETKQAFERANTQDQMDSVNNKINEQILNANDAYKNQQNNELALEEKMNQMNENYLSAIENGNTEAAQALKKELDKAVQEWQAAKSATDKAAGEALGVIGADGAAAKDASDMAESAAKAAKDASDAADSAANAAKDASDAAEAVVKAAKDIAYKMETTATDAPSAIEAAIAAEAAETAAKEAEAAAAKVGATGTETAKNAAEAAVKSAAAAKDAAETAAKASAAVKDAVETETKAVTAAKDAAEAATKDAATAKDAAETAAKTSAAAKDASNSAATHANTGAIAEAASRAAAAAKDTAVAAKGAADATTKAVASANGVSDAAANAASSNAINANTAAIADAASKVASAAKDTAIAAANVAGIGTIDVETAGAVANAATAAAAAVTNAAATNDEAAKVVTTTGPDNVEAMASTAANASANASAAAANAAAARDAAAIATTAAEHAGTDTARAAAGMATEAAAAATAAADAARTAADTAANALASAVNAETAGDAAMDTALAAAGKASEAADAALAAADATANAVAAAVNAEAAATSGITGEETAMAALVDRLNSQYAPYTFQDPSFLIFENYDVHLKRPIMYHGKNIYVDARDLAGQMGAEVALSKINNAVVIRGKGALIEYIVGNKALYVNDKKTDANPPPLYIEGYEYIPLASFEKAYNLSERREGEYTYVYK